jgi:hypothetical protein
MDKLLVASNNVQMTNIESKNHRKNQNFQVILKIKKKKNIRP